MTEISATCFRRGAVGAMILAAVATTCLGLAPAAAQDGAPDYVALLRRYAALQEDVKWTLRDVDAFIVPTTMAPAWPLTKIDASSETYMDYNMRVHRNTGLGNLLNFCAVSVPCGFTSGGLPIGLMIYAKPFAEDMALRVAYAFEQATEWHTRHPDLAWLGKGG